MNREIDESGLVRFVNTRWPVLAVAALLLPAWSLRTIVNTLADQRRAEVNPLSSLVVKVVAGDPPVPVENAEIVSAYSDKQGIARLTMTPLGNGEYQLDRAQLELQLFISTADRQQGAIAVVGPGETSTTVTVSRLMSATGRLVSDATGEPMGNVEIEWDLPGQSHWVHSRGPRPVGCGGTSRTNPDGTFTLVEFIPGVTYELLVTMEMPHFGRMIDWGAHLRTVRLEAGSSTELGDLVVERREGLEERFVRNFELGVPVAERLARAQVSAKELNQHIIAVLGDPHDEAALRTRDSVYGLFELKFQVLCISIAGPEGEAGRQWARELGIDVGDGAARWLVVFDEELQPLGHLKVESLAFGAASGDRFAAFLTEHAPPEAKRPVPRRIGQ